MDGTPIRLIPLGRPAHLARLARLARLAHLAHLVSLESLGPLGDMADLVVLDVYLAQESRVALVVLGVLVFHDLHVSPVFQGHHVLLASQLPLVVQDNLGLPADLAVREYLAFPVVLLALAVLAVRGCLADLAVRAVRGCLADLADLAVRAVQGCLVLLGVPGGPLLAAVDAFRALLGCSKWQAGI